MEKTQKVDCHPKRLKEMFFTDKKLLSHYEGSYTYKLSCYYDNRNYTKKIWLIFKRRKIQIPYQNNDTPANKEKLRPDDL